MRPLATSTSVTHTNPATLVPRISSCAPHPTAPTRHTCQPASREPNPLAYTHRCAALAEISRRRSPREVQKSTSLQTAPSIPLRVWNLRTAPPNNV
eukprot:84013-Pyramimonas_sp.AAC.3